MKALVDGIIDLFHITESLEHGVRGRGDSLTIEYKQLQVKFYLLALLYKRFKLARSFYLDIINRPKKLLLLSFFSLCYLLLLHCWLIAHLM